MHHTVPEPPLPAQACDCHTHVFLEPAAFPLWPERRYTPPPASIEALAAMHALLGIQRVVVVQPSVYGADNAATLQALRVLGPARARGVAVIDPQTSAAALDEMAAAGVRGVRVNLEVGHASDVALATAALQRTAERVAPLGWHVQVYASLSLLAACHSALAALPVPLVLDHYACAQGRLGAQQSGLDAVLALVESGKAYVKLSAPYRLSQLPHYADMQALAQRFVRTRPDRMLWGSDWPHPQPDTRDNPLDVSPPFEVDSGRVLNDLHDWVADAATFQRILVDNPAQLYGFDG